MVSSMGRLENLAGLRQSYGLSKSVNEVLLVIEAYRALRDRAPYPAHHVVGDLSGHFAFILYDHQTRKIFVAAVLKLSTFFLCIICFGMQYNLRLLLLCVI